MNKISKMILIVIFSLLSISIVNASLSKSKLTEEEIESYEGKWYILSDKYENIKECEDEKEKNNKNFSNYKRSNCFEYSNKNYYFICWYDNYCIITTSTMSSSSIQQFNNSTGSTTTIPNKVKLDNYLSEIKLSEQILNNDVEYKKELDIIITNLSFLWKKYKNDTEISKMVSYLTKWINKIK